MITLHVNGANRRLDIDPDTPLLWALRDHLGLQGTKYSCGIGECGACTVHVDGRAVASCSITAGEAAGKKIVTIEKLEGAVGEALKRAWLKGDVPQCGYCQPGQLMAAAALLMHKPKPTDAEIDAAMDGVLCRCGTYQEIRSAIHEASKELSHG